MNKKVIIILISTILSLVVLTMFSFGPLSNIRKQSGINLKSLNPVQQSPEKSVSPQNQNNSDSNQIIDLNIYRNVDVKENYYQVSIPKNWQVTAGNAPGGYAVSFSGGSGQIGLMDIPDNTTLELFLLSQEEPKLKKTVSNYQRLDYQKITVNSNEGYELIYGGETTQKKSKTITAYIAGQDHAGVISFSASLDAFSSLQPMFEKVINSFTWQNK
jgi:hypothetical protein